MKQLIALFSIGASAFAGQTNETFPLIQAGGRSFTNATIASISGTDAIIIHAGGGSRVPVEALPENIRASLNYDAAEAKKKAEEMKAKQIESAQKQAAYQAALKSAEAVRGEAKKIQVIELRGAMGRDRILAAIEGEGTREILTVVSADIKNRFADIKRREQEFDAYRPRVERAIKDAELANAKAPTFVSGNANWVAQKEAEMNRAKEMMADAKEMAEKLARMGAEIKEARAALKSRSVFYAAKTAQKYGGLEIWMPAQ